VLPFASEISVQPLDQTLAEGSNVIFGIGVSGSPPFNFQWFFNLTNALSNATNSALILTNLQVTDAGSYHVVVTSPYGEATSQVAVLTVLTFPPQITLQPQNRTVMAGANATFSVTSTGSPLLVYQWYFNQTNPLSGATSANLTLTNVQASQQGGYNVVVSNPYGAATSQVAHLTVLLLPQIVAQPQSQLIKAGSNANFSVTATGGLPLFYRWYFNDTNVLGSNAPNLVVANAGSNQIGGYLVVVSNAYGMATSLVARLDLIWPLVISQPPSSQTVVAHENVTFVVAITNNTRLPIGYRWCKGSVPITNILLDAYTCSFTMYDVQTNNTSTSGPGVYRVIVTNAANVPGVYSAFATLTVVTASPPVAVTLAVSNLMGTTATVSGTVNPKGATTRAWFEYGLTTNYGGSTAITNVGRGTNALSLSQDLDGLLPATNYHYRLVATNFGGTSLGVDMVFQTAVEPLPPEPTICRCTRLADRRIKLEFSGITNGIYAVLGSTNLSQWAAEGAAVEVAPGVFEFIDDDAPSHETCFYRLRSP
jgi:hypothetical protein